MVEIGTILDEIVGKIANAFNQEWHGALEEMQSPKACLHGAGSVRTYTWEDTNMSTVKSSFTGGEPH